MQVPTEIAGLKHFGRDYRISLLQQELPDFTIMEGKGLADFTITKEKTDNPEGEKGQYRGVSDKSRVMFSCEICH